MSLPINDMEDARNILDEAISEYVDMAYFSDPCEKHLDGGVKNKSNHLAGNFPSLHKFPYDGFRFFIRSNEEETPNDFSYVLNNEYSQFSFQPGEHFTIHDSEKNNEKCCIESEYSLYNKSVSHDDGNF